MKNFLKTIFLIPGIFFVLFVVFIGINIQDLFFEPAMYLFALIPLVSSIFLAKEKWWGSIFGILFGLYITIVGKESFKIGDTLCYFGLITTSIYMIFGILAYKYFKKS